MEQAGDKQMLEELKTAMMEAVHEFFEDRISLDASSGNVEHKLQLATAALLLSMVKADRQTRVDELQSVKRAIEAAFDLSEEETHRLVRLSEEQVKVPGAFAEFTHLIDVEFDAEQKKAIVTMLWQVAYADAELSASEEYLVRKLAGHLHVPLVDFLDAKIKARDLFE